MLEAERSSLFLYDEKSDELRIKVSEDMKAGEIRFKADKGIAGYVARERKVLNIEDAYSHKLFNLVSYSMLFRDSPYSTGHTEKSIEKARCCEIPEPPFMENYPEEEFGANTSIKNYIRDSMKNLRQKKDGGVEEADSESVITL